jgi:hypothetical protein
MRWAFAVGVGLVGLVGLVALGVGRGSSSGAQKFQIFFLFPSLILTRFLFAIQCGAGLGGSSYLGCRCVPPAPPFARVLHCLLFAGALDIAHLKRMLSMQGWWSSASRMGCGAARAEGEQPRCSISRVAAGGGMPRHASLLRTRDVNARFLIIGASRPEPPLFP